jgi:hypothetical protein
MGTLDARYHRPELRDLPIKQDQTADVKLIGKDIEPLQHLPHSHAIPSSARKCVMDYPLLLC